MNIIHSRQNRQGYLESFVKDDKNIGAKIDRWGCLFGDQTGKENV